MPLAAASAAMAADRAHRLARGARPSSVCANLDAPRLAGLVLALDLATFLLAGAALRALETDGPFATIPGGSGPRPDCRSPRSWRRGWRRSSSAAVFDPGGGPPRPPRRSRRPRFARRAQGDVVAAIRRPLVDAPAADLRRPDGLDGARRGDRRSRRRVRAARVRGLSRILRPTLRLITQAPHRPLPAKKAGRGDGKPRFLQRRNFTSAPPLPAS